MVAGALVAGALVGGFGGTCILKPATGRNWSGGGGLVFSTLGGGTFVVRGKAPATAMGGPVYEDGFAGCAWGGIALDWLGWAPSGWAGLHAVKLAPSAASITRATWP